MDVVSFMSRLFYLPGRPPDALWIDLMSFIADPDVVEKSNIFAPAMNRTLVVQPVV
jgi:hypothetical protein